MSVESKKEIQLEIAHVLFIDIVGYNRVRGKPFRIAEIKGAAEALLGEAGQDK